MGSLSLLQGNFLTQESHRGLLYCTQIIYQLSYQGSPIFITQLLKNLPAMWETWVQSLGWDDSLEKGKATPSSVLAWRIPWTVLSTGPQSWTRLSDLHFTSPVDVQQGRCFPACRPGPRAPALPC